jgi:hypothetical protein
MRLLKPLEKREPLVERLTLTLTKSQFTRVRELGLDLDNRGLTKITDLIRERINELLDEVEDELAKSG